MHHPPKQVHSYNMEKIGKRFEGKVAIVTASTQGIGYAIAERLGIEGASVVVSSRKQKNVDDAVEKLKSKGIQVLGVVCHVSNALHRKNMIEQTIENYGKIDVIVSNAGVNPSPDAILNTKESALDKLWEVNVKASVLLLQGLANEMAPNTRVNCIASGYVPTNFAQIITGIDSIRKPIIDIIPLKRPGTTQEIAAAASFLASDEASYVTGETLAVAGGFPSRL